MYYPVYLTVYTISHQNTGLEKTCTVTIVNPVSIPMTWVMSFWYDLYQSRGLGILLFVFMEQAVPTSSPRYTALCLVGMICNNPVA